MWTIYKVFIVFVNNIASVLCFGFFATRHVGPGIRPASAALEGEVLTIGPTGK